MTRGRKPALTPEEVEEVHQAWDANIAKWILYRTYGGERYDRPHNLSMQDLATRFRVSQGVIQHVIDKKGAYSES